MKRLIILGASGSIGTQTIDVCKKYQDEFEIVGAAVGKNVEYLKELLNTFNIKYACTIDKNDELINLYPNVTFFYGDEGLVKMVQIQEYDILVNALVGFTGFIPTLRAIENHKDVALANKETLVAGGDIINEALKTYKTNLYPIDSEHSAIFQCMSGNRYEDIRKLIVTGSGGSFRDLKIEELSNVSVEDALKHPCWSMGAKITIDSATMMNKGFEVIEAHYLFDIDYDDIDVILHRESIVHSMVEFNDGSIIAQLGNPDMRIPIQYALMHPRHKDSPIYDHLDLAKVMTLNFKEMDYERYPLVRIAKEIGKKGGNLGAILNGANDKAVALFLEHKISFLDIQESIIKTLKHAKYIAKPSVEDIVESHAWASQFVLDMHNKNL